MSPASPRVRADFNGDGAEDLAIGQFLDLEGEFISGSVNVLYGRPGGGLSGTGSQIFRIGVDGIPGEPEELFDGFGWALAVGDFDDDGFDDLAVGNIDDRVAGLVGAGSVTVIYGAAGGLNEGRASQLLHQDNIGVDVDPIAAANLGAALATGDLDGDGIDDLVMGARHHDLVDVVYGSATGLLGGRATRTVAQPIGGFGSTLAIGNFNGSGPDDLAVGAPGASVGTITNAGVVRILFGSSAGVTGNGQTFHQGVAGVVSDPENGDGFGSALAAGDFNADGIEDLGIGVQGESAGTVRGAGAINVLYGRAGGLSGTGSVLFHQGSTGVVSDPETFDAFGWALAAGDFNADGADDLSIGVPGESVGTIEDAGAINVLHGGPRGLSGRGSVLFHQGVAGVVSDPENGDAFGSALAAGDFNADGTDDVAIGVPEESVGTVILAGAVNVLPGSSTGLTGRGSTLFTQDVAGVPGTVGEGNRFGGALAAIGS